MLLTTIIEGIGLGALLVLVCAVGIRKGAVGLLHLYEPDVQERCISMGLTTKERIKHNQMLFKVVCLPIYIAYILVCVYVINGARAAVLALGRRQEGLILRILDQHYLIPASLVENFEQGSARLHQMLRLTLPVNFQTVLGVCALARHAVSP